MPTAPIRRNTSREMCRVALDGADLVIGSRMSGASSEMPLVRRIGNTIFATLLSVVAGVRISDSASGQRVIRREVLPMLYPLPDTLDFTPAMSTRALHEDLRIVEVPIPYKERSGRSKLSVVRDGLRFFKSIVWTALTYNPVRLFGGLSAALLLTSRAGGWAAAAGASVRRAGQWPFPRLYRRAGAGSRRDHALHNRYVVQLYRGAVSQAPDSPGAVRIARQRAQDRAALLVAGTAGGAGRDP